MEDKARFLNFNKFIEDRSVEISKFLVDLALDTKKKGHQALQKSVRRRAMSHNRFRIPRRLRKNMEEDLAKAERMQKIPKCRKHIRKRRHLITAYRMRSQKNQWLSTHLWAARRMKMINYYGFRVAFTPNNKSFRSAYRHTQHGCTVADLSYYYVLTLTSKDSKQELPKFLKLSQYPLLGKIYEGQIASLQSLICPCYLVRSQSSTNTILRVLVHPAALTEVRKLGIPQGWQASMQQGQVDIYFLNGPQSLSIIEEALKSYGMIPNQQQIQSKFYARKSAAVYFNLPSNNYSLSNKPLIDAPIALQKTLVQGYNKKANAAIRSKMMALFSGLTNDKKEIDQNIEEKSFWQMFEAGQNQSLEKTIFKITLRSRYTHRRKNKMTKEEKKIAVRAERQSSTERGKGRMKDQSQEAGESSYQQKRIFVQQSTAKKQNAVFQAVNPLMVASLQSDSYLVWVSNADSCRFWRILSKLNTKIIGRKQLNHLYLERGKRSFPEDYPETKSYKSYREEELKKGFEKYIKLPIQKRTNYLQLRSPFPFAGFTATTPKMIEIQIVSRGHCEPFSYICQLQSQDLKIIAKKIETGHSSIIYSEEGEGERRKYKQLSELQEDLTKIEVSRKIIGVVTSGGYRYSRSREGGLGFVDEALVSSTYFNEFEGYVLVRKANSPHYVLAQILRELSSM